MPPNTENVFSYIESRGGQFDYSLFSGLQGFLKERLAGKFVTQEMINDAEVFYKKTFGYDYFNKAGWQYILDNHEGRLPVVIKAVPEGSKIPKSNALVTIEATDEKCWWLVQYLETMLLRAVWYPTTVATLSSTFKDILKAYAEKTGCEISPFGLLDFGARGVSSGESCEIGAAAHLVNFLGTDSAEGVRWAMRNYDTDVCGFSVMATEHSCTSAWGEENELKAYEHFLNVAPDDSILSIVIDTYNDERAVKEMIGGVLKEKVMSRKGKTVFRPDSGDIREVPVKVTSWLWDAFGGTVNEKGFKVLDPHVQCLQGDSVSLEVLTTVLDNLVEAKFATSNVMFGMGAKLLASPQRDDQKFAMKASAVKINGEWHDVYKKPKGDPSKASKRGRLKLVIGDNGYETVREEDPRPNQLVEVFRNGVVTKEWTFDEVKARANS